MVHPPTGSKGVAVEEEPLPQRIRSTGKPVKSYYWIDTIS